jgi:YVTN family beta-propeller protein
VALHDATTLELLRTLDVGSVPIGSVIEPSGRRAYVAFSGDDRVGVIDLSTWQVVDTISTGDEPDGMALTGRP